MLLNPLQAVLPFLSELERFHEGPGGLAIRLKGLDVEWEGRHIRFLDGEVRLSAGPPSAIPATRPGPPSSAGSPRFA